MVFGGSWEVVASLVRVEVVVVVVEVGVEVVVVVVVEHRCDSRGE